MCVKVRFPTNVAQGFYAPVTSHNSKHHPYLLFSPNILGYPEPRPVEQHVEVDICVMAGHRGVKPIGANVSEHDLFS